MFNNKTKAVQDTKPFCRLSIPTARLRINNFKGYGMSLMIAGNIRSPLALGPKRCAAAG